MLKIVLILLECESTMLEQSICNHVISASSASIIVSTFNFQLFSTVTLLYPVVVGTLPHSQLNGLWKRRKLLIRKLGSEALNKEIGLFGLQHPLSVAAMKLQTYRYPVSTYRSPVMYIAPGCNIFPIFLLLKLSLITLLQVLSVHWFSLPFPGEPLRKYAMISYSMMLKTGPVKQLVKLMHFALIISTISLSFRYARPCTYAHFPLSINI